MTTRSAANSLTTELRNETSAGFGRDHGYRNDYRDGKRLCAGDDAGDGSAVMVSMPWSRGACAPHSVVDPIQVFRLSELVRFGSIAMMLQSNKIERQPTGRGAAVIDLDEYRLVAFRI